MQKAYTPQSQVQPTALGPCYECSGPHLVRDCPQRRRPPNTGTGPPVTTTPRMQFPPIERYYTGCSVEHLPKDCLIKPADPAASKGNVTLNLVSVIPSPTTSETEGETVPIRVVTRAQKHAQAQTEEIKINT